MKKLNFAAVLVKVNNKILLCKRSSDNSFPNTWSVPGGKVEDGEEIIHAAVREFKEETDIDISESDLKFMGVVPRVNEKHGKLKGFMYLYLLEVDEEIYPNLDNAKDGYEHTLCDYFTVKQLKNINYDYALTKFFKTL